MDEHLKVLQLTNYINSVIVISTTQSKSRIFFHPTTICKDEYGTDTFQIYGGLNGGGDWGDYFQDLTNFTKRLKSSLKKLWLIKLENDCPDDVFTATFGFEM